MSYAISFSSIDAYSEFKDFAIEIINRKKSSGYNWSLVVLFYSALMLYKGYCNLFNVNFHRRHDKNLKYIKVTFPPYVYSSFKTLYNASINMRYDPGAISSFNKKSHSEILKKFKGYEDQYKKFCNYIASEMKNNTP